MEMNTGYPKNCKNFKSGNILLNNVAKQITQDRAFKFGLFVEEVSLLNFKAFVILSKNAEFSIFTIYAILTSL